MAAALTASGEGARRYDLVIFDLDGTLADTKEDLAAATNHALARLGLPTHPPERIGDFVGGGIRLLLQRAAGEPGTDPALVDRALELFLPFYRDHLLDRTRPYPGVDELLERLERSGVKLAMATNKARVFTAKLVAALFPRRFDPIVACGDDVPRKPDPTCVTRAIARHPGVSRGRIGFVGDSPVDVETASKAGVSSLAVSWGFSRREDLASAGPAYLVNRVAELGAIILGVE